MKLIDANVFVYATGAPHPYRDPCRHVLTQVEADRLEAKVDTEVLQEVMHVYWYRRRAELGLLLVDRLLVLFPTPFPVTRTTITTARDVLAGYPRLDPRDAIHAAVVLNENLEAIISADRSFDEMTEIKRLDPRELYP